MQALLFAERTQEFLSPKASQSQGEAFLPVGVDAIGPHQLAGCIVFRFEEKPENLFERQPFGWHASDEQPAQKPPAAPRCFGQRMLATNLNGVIVNLATTFPGGDRKRASRLAIPRSDTQGSCAYLSRIQVAKAPSAPLHKAPEKRVLKVRVQQQQAQYPAGRPGFSPGDLRGGGLPEFYSARCRSRAVIGVPSRSKS